jgi:predicted nucleic acid-binding protein
MRAVIDTGVLISAAIKMQSTPSLAIHRAVQSSVLLKSRSTEDEFLDVIERPYLARFISAEAREQMMRVMESAEFMTSPSGSPLAAMSRTTNFWSWL